MRIIRACIVATLLSAALPSAAQEATDSVSSDNNIFNHLSIGLNIGTPGIGIDVSAPITRYVAVRAGVNFFPTIKWSDDFYFGGASEYNSLRYNHPELNLPETSLGSSEDVDYEASIHNTTGHVLFDIYPGKNAAFHFTLGAYFGGGNVIQAKNKEKGIFRGISQYNNFVEQHPEAGYDKIGVEFDDNYLLEPDDDGNVQGNIHVSGFRPYVGIGVGRAIPKNRMGFQFDFGVMFWNKPKVYCQGHELTKMPDEYGDSDDGDIMKIAKHVIGYPVINFRIITKIL